MKANSLTALALSAMLFAACGGPLKYTPKSADRAPGANIEIVADVQEKTSNTRLNVTTKFLPPPATLQEKATTYVAWQRTNPDSVWMRVGALTYDDKSREGVMKDVTVPETKFEFMITAEAVPNAPTPSADVVVTQKVGK